MPNLPELPPTPRTTFYSGEMLPRGLERFEREGLWLLLSLHHYGWRAHVDMSALLVGRADTLNLGEQRTFRDERGRELFDLPDAPRPDPDTPAPPRLLPEYDNLLLSHADRSRFHHDDALKARFAGPVQGAVLSDGLVCGVWHVEREMPEGNTTLVVEHAAALTTRAKSALVAEGRRFLRFGAANAEALDVRFVPAG